MNLDKEKLLEWLRERMRWYEERMPNEAWGEVTWIYKDEWGECDEFLKQIESGNYDLKEVTT